GDERPRATLHEAVLMCAVSAVERLSGRQIVHVHSRHGADYVFQGIQTGRFCIYNQKVTNRTVWDGLMASQAAGPYSISISDVGTFASIPSFFPQRTFYESFAACGAFDCGPAPNIRF